MKLGLGRDHVRGGGGEESYFTARPSSASSRRIFSSVDRVKNAMDIKQSCPWGAMARERWPANAHGTVNDRGPSVRDPTLRRLFRKFGYAQYDFLCFFLRRCFAIGWPREILLFTWIISYDGSASPDVSFLLSVYRWRGCDTNLLRGLIFPPVVFRLPTDRSFVQTLSHPGDRPGTNVSASPSPVFVACSRDC